MGVEFVAMDRIDLMFLSVPETTNSELINGKFGDFRLKQTAFQIIAFLLTTPHHLGW